MDRGRGESAWGLGERRKIAGTQFAEAILRFQVSTGRQTFQIYCDHSMGARLKNGGLQEGREGPLGGEGLPGPGLERRNC